jgi:hypothetical protein
VETAISFASTSTNSSNQELKRRIRVLRLISRVLAFIISVAVLIPITMTLVKFLTTKDVVRDAPTASGTTAPRTPWARGTQTWQTYMYFSIAASSFLLNGIIMIAYLRDIRAANKAATVATTFTWTVIIANVVVWGVGAGLYKWGRSEAKEKDLWGWSCSSGAARIQEVFQGEVKFGSYCNIQSFSWYMGLVQAGAGLLSVVIFLLVLRRKKTKKGKRQSERRLMENY